jgi:glycosyltransferase involved in cell wall biosynthesis
MIANRNIMLFSSDDWASGLKSSKYHVAVGLSKRNKVLFVNSIGLRNPSASVRDIKRVWHKAISFLRGWERIDDNLFVYTPIVIPFHRSRLMRRINQLILIYSLRTVQFLLKLERPVLLVFSPNFHDVVGHLGESGTVYYCIDELKAYREVDTAMLDDMERALLAKADCVVGCSQELVDAKRPFNPNVYYVPHGVEWSLFRKTLDDTLELPLDVRRLPKPIIGYYGFISEDWIDFDLLNAMAARHPEWSLVLIGRTKLNLDAVLKHGNIHFLGVRPFEQLPDYSRAFNVAIIPFAINALTESSNPLKLLEYLASGLPVVSVNIPEVARYARLVKIAGNHDEFIRLTEEALIDRTIEQDYRRSDSVRSETWERRLELLSEIITEHCHPVAPPDSRRSIQRIVNT